MKRYARGDFAITVNSRAPSVNDGHLVIIREVCGPMPERGLDFADGIARHVGAVVAGVLPRR